ncbi:MAG: pyrroloquinoline quinone biosynthesis protein PqqB [Hyphomicrobiaceae bacterium]|nr:pyrroloquinoline quinone biosynthesis protein PqqB [Hyphomicrobiaceae bacterium]
MAQQSSPVMIIRVLGSAAGGGFPQLNCACRLCRGVRRGEAGLAARTQTSLAVSVDGERWLLLNASPDLRAQLAAAPALQAQAGTGVRNSPIGAVVLTNGDVDAVAGLLGLREGFAFDLYAAGPVLEALAGNAIFNVLAPGLVPRRPLPVGRPVEVLPGLAVEAFLVPGKTALYLETEAPDFGTRAGDTIGLEVRGTAGGARFFFVPSCAGVDAALRARLAGAPLVLFDGTLYTDDEMIAQGLSPKTGQRMGHMAMAGPAGSVAALADVAIARRIFIHINNSNPVLDASSPERRAVETAGWEIAADGMEIEL